MIYDTAIKESSNILDLLIENCETSFDIFNEVIESDFAEASEIIKEDASATRLEDKSKSDIIDLGDDEFSKSNIKESKIKTVLNKIRDILKNLYEKVMDFIDLWIDKLQNLFSRDNSLYEKYHKDFMNNYKNLKVKYRPIRSNLSKIIETDPVALLTDKNTVAPVSKVYNEIGSCVDKDSVNSCADLLIASIKKKDPQKIAEEFVFTADEPNTEIALSSSDANTIDSIMKDGKKILQSARRTKAVYKSYFKGAVDGCNEGKLKSIIKKEDLALEAYNAIGRVLSPLSSYYAKLLTAFINNINKALAEVRRIFLACARTNEPSEATEAYIIGELSDIYMEQTLLCCD